MWKPQYFDIAVNLTDRMFHGDYNDKNYHPPDLEDVLKRAQALNVRKILITGSSLTESELAIKIARDDAHVGNLYSTVGVHPCSVGEIARYDQGEAVYLQKLLELALKGKKEGVVKSFGEIGLDYDRLHFAPLDLQKKFFEEQLKIACKVDLPLFLHMRAACDDFVEIIAPFVNGTRSDGLKLSKLGVVHSFTGTEEELDKLLSLGFHIGVNGCSLKTELNLEVSAKIPLERLMIETDSPWCEIRKSSACYDMITPYPNVCYPEIPIDKVYLQEIKQTKKSAGLKFDNFLPFISLKRDNYSKFMKELLDKDEVMSIGKQSPPLIKSRNEPAFIGLVAEVMAKLYGVEPKVVIDKCFQNSCEMFQV